MLAELTSRLLRRRQQRDQQHAKSQEQIVADVADDKLTDPDAILDVLEEIDLTPFTLQEAVRELQHRRSLQEILKGEPELLKRKSAADAKLDKAKSEFEAAKKKWNASQDSIGAEQTQCQQQLARCEHVRGLLRQNPSLEAKERAGEVSNELTQLNGQRTRLRRLLSDHSFLDTATSRTPTFARKKATIEKDIRHCSRKDAPPSEKQRVPTLKGGLKIVETERRAAEKELVAIEKQIAKQMKKIKAADRELVLS